MKRTWLKTTLLGTALCALLGSGLWAVVIDSASVHDNTIDSGDYAGTRDLEVRDGFNQCLETTGWTKDMGPQFVGTVDLDNGDIRVTPSEEGSYASFCARSNLQEPQKLRIGLKEVDHEVIHHANPPIGDPDAHHFLDLADPFEVHLGCRSFLGRKLVAG